MSNAWMFTNKIICKYCQDSQGLLCHFSFIQDVYRNQSTKSKKYRMSKNIVKFTCGEIIMASCILYTNLVNRYFRDLQCPSLHTVILLHYPVVLFSRARALAKLRVNIIFANKTGFTVVTKWYIKTNKHNITSFYFSIYILFILFCYYTSFRVNILTSFFYLFLKS